MKIVAIVQARMGSTRLPNKVMKPIGGVPMIELLLARLAKSTQIDQIVLATSTDERNTPLVEHVQKLGYTCVRGSESDVLDRYLVAARQAQADVVVRITGDCPLIDPALVDQVIEQFKAQGVDYLSNVAPASYPNGLDTEVFTLQALERAGRESQDTDMSIMGIGTNILGYGHEEVDAAVRQTVDAGNMSTFNCPEEVYLAEKLVELHPWADMARLARSGGEANALAIRIARAATGKDKVAVCGYHGWHDWYLSANLGDDENLAGHLLPGLDPKGVPQNLRGTVFPFNYNNYAELENLVNTQDIGVIKMEVVRNKGPEDNFLHKVRKLATDRGIVLIFDECTSGFRQTFGGLHKMYGVEPDMAMFGKALGNGYAITATIGRREVMEAAQSTFISSTFWTERIGPTAALKTLEVMERTQSWDTITQTGLNIRQRWQQLADKHGLQIDHWGLPALTGYTFKSDNALAYKTLITQEMLAKGYLAGNSVYVCTEHTPAVLDGYFAALDPIFATIKECEEGRDVISLLKGPVCHGGFKRLN